MAWRTRAPSFSPNSTALTGRRRSPRPIIALPFARRFRTQFTSPNVPKTYRRPSCSKRPTGVVYWCPDLRPLTVSSVIGPIGTPILRRLLISGFINGTKNGTLPFDMGHSYLRAGYSGALGPAFDLGNFKWEARRDLTHRWIRKTSDCWEPFPEREAELQVVGASGLPLCSGCARTP